MNPSTLEEAQDLFNFTKNEYAKISTNYELVICPPFIYLEEISKMLNSPDPRYAGFDLVKLGAQDIFWESTGAYTGEISSNMLKNFRISHVLVGHSDRRYVIGETDEIINRKVKATLLAGLTPVLLVGEREINDIRENILTDQLSRDLKDLTPERIAKTIFVYEPVWAISTREHGHADTPENAVAAIQILNDILIKSFRIPSPVPVFYGGSVNESNIEAFLNRPEIGGVVIGAASLRKDEFGRILKLVSLIR